ncbi:MAG: hypothetical protein RLZZ546_781 [Bacteroidota bacterium]|jgi:predicted MFS family arabinose efflux permease
MSKGEKIALIILAALNFTHILDFMILMPLGNFLMPYFNLSTQQFSYLVSAYAISAGSSSFISAFYVNNFDRKKILLYAYVGFLIGTLACGLAPTYVFLFLARIVTGIFGGMISAQVLSIVADLIPFERRGSAMGIVMAAFAFASSIGVPFSLYLANFFDWQMPFFFIATLGLIFIPLIIKFIPSLTMHIGKNELSKIDIISQIFKNKNQSLAILFSGFMMMGHFLIIPFINPFLEFNKGYDKSFTPLVYLFGGIASLISANLFGRLADVYGKWKIYTLCVFLCLPLIIMITNLPSISKYLVLVIFVLWFSFATGRGVAAQALVSNVAPPESRGSFQSFVSFMQQIGTGMASLIAGWIVIKDESHKLLHYNVLGYFSIFVLLLTILIGYNLFSSKKA